MSFTQRRVSSSLWRQEVPATKSAADQTDRALRYAIAARHRSIRFRTVPDRHHVSIGELRSTVPLAALLSALRHHVRRIIGWRSQKQMIRINATRNVTSVANQVITGRLAAEMLISPTVRPEPLLANAERSIASRIDSADPNPATIFREFNARQKSLDHRPNRKPATTKRARATTKRTWPTATACSVISGATRMPAKLALLKQAGRLVRLALQSQTTMQTVTHAMRIAQRENK